jgi:hypothetical protein
MDENVTAKAMRSPDPEEFLAQLREDFLRNADQHEQEALHLAREIRDLEERSAILRARAGSLRTAAGGVEAALERFNEEVAKAKAVRHEQESLQADRDVPSKSGYSVKIPQEYR